MRYDKEEIENRIKSKRKKENIIITVIYIVVIPIIILYLFFIAQTILEPDTEFNVCGLQQYTIISNSMQPTINKNDVIFVKKCAEDAIKENDIITFVRENETITHRVVKIEIIDDKTKFYTKGDNNQIEDKEYVEYNNIKGKYLFKIARIGKIMLLLKRTDMFLTILIILFTLYLYERRINKKRIKRHNERIKYEIENEKNNPSN